MINKLSVNLRHPLIKISCAVIVWAIAVFGISIISDATFQDREDASYTGIGLFSGAKKAATTLIRWDAVHYVRIADKGYPDRFKDLRAFFPVYPLVMRYGHRIFNVFVSNPLISFLITSLIVNVFCLIMSLFFVRSLYQTDFKEENSLMPSLLMLMSPWAFFYLSFYPEALFLFLSTGGFLAAVKRKWFLACLLAGIASATRVQGIILLPAFFVEYLHQREWKLKNIRADILWLIMCSFGFIAHIQFVVGGIDKYRAIQEKWKNVDLDFNILTAIKVYFKNLSVITHTSLAESFAFAVLIISIALLIYFWKQLRHSYKVYMILSIAVPMSASTLLGLGRYCTVLFPFYFAAAKLLGKRHVVLYSVIMILGMISALFAALFTNGHYVS